MSELLADLLVLLVEIYFGLGLLFAVPFVLRGAGAIDPTAREGTWGFRLLILPGSAALWPWLAWRWWRGAPRPVEDNPHRRAARSGEGP